MTAIKTFLQSLERERAIEASKLTFAIIGVGTVLGEISVTKFDLMAVFVAVFSAAWWGVYRMFA